MDEYYSVNELDDWNKLIKCDIAATELNGTIANGVVSEYTEYQLDTNFMIIIIIITYCGWRFSCI